MYVMTTEIWPFGMSQNKRPILQIIGYNTQRETPEGYIWYENIVAENFKGGLNSSQEIISACDDSKLDTLKGVFISVAHNREEGMAALLEKILVAYRITQPV